jgi:hypothetical protein
MQLRVRWDRVPGAVEYHVELIRQDGRWRFMSPDTQLVVPAPSYGTVRLRTVGVHGHSRWTSPVRTEAPRSRWRDG